MRRLIVVSANVKTRAVLLGGLNLLESVPVRRIPLRPRIHVLLWLMLGLSLSAALSLAADRPVVTGVVNGASFEPNIAAGSWVTIFGENLAPSTRIWRADEIVDGKLPTSLDGVSVTINNKPAAVYFISPTQINVQAPDDSSVGQVQVLVTTQDGGTSDLAIGELSALSPGLFAFDPEGRRYVAAVHPDGTYVAKDGMFPTAPTRLAKPGDVIMLFGTGFGPTDPAVPAGLVFTGAAAVTQPITVRIGEVVADVAYAGLVGAGLCQLNVTIPELPDGDHPVVAEIGGLRTQTGAFVSVSDPEQQALLTPGAWTGEDIYFFVASDGTRLIVGGPLSRSLQMGIPTCTGTLFIGMEAVIPIINGRFDHTESGTQGGGWSIAVSGVFDSPTHASVQVQHTNSAGCSKTTTGYEATPSQ